MNAREELKSAGVYPSGPVSAWPRSRHDRLTEQVKQEAGAQEHTTRVEASVGKMGRGLLKTAGQALRHGRVSAEIRNERYNTCKACPLFDPESKRCTDCGCFMEAKTWVGGNPDMLCPKQKWSR